MNNAASISVGSKVVAQIKYCGKSMKIGATVVELNGPNCIVTFDGESAPVVLSIANIKAV